MFWIIYLIGYVTGYYTYRWSIKDQGWTWGDVGMGAIIPMFSWITVIFGLCIIFFEKYEKPPKWL